MLRSFSRFVFLLASLASAQGTISTVAGGGVFVFPTGPIAATNAPLGQVSTLAMDGAGNLYAAAGSQVVKITPAGTLTTVWNGNASQIAVDPAGNVYVLYYVNTMLIGVLTFVTKIDPSGATSSVNAQINCCSNPAGIATDAQGNFYYVGDSGYHVVRIAPDGSHTTLPITFGEAQQHINGMLVDGQGNCYFSQGDTAFNDNPPMPGRILKATPSGVFTTIAGGSASGYSGDGGPATQSMLNFPQQMALDAAGNLYIADMSNNRIRKIFPNGIITTIAGSSTAGLSGDGGPASTALLSSPKGVVLDRKGNLYVGDSLNSRIRKIDANGVITEVAGNGKYGVAGDGGPATQASLVYPTAVVADPDNNLYAAELAARIRKIGADGTISVLAGNGIGFSGDGGPAIDALFSSPRGLAMDAARNLYVADTGNNRIRKISADGMVTTIAGGGTGADCNNCTATSAVLNGPLGVAVDAAGIVYIADTANCAVRKVSPGITGMISTLASFPASQHCRTPSAVATDHAGNLYAAISATGATFADGFIVRIAPDGTITNVVQGVGNPAALAFDAAGSLYIANFFPSIVYRLDPGGVLTPVAGNGTVASPQGFSGDGGPAVAAQLANPQGIAVDSNGFLYIADSSNNRIRRVVGPSCTGAAEPSFTINLPAGFYIATVRNPPASRDGYWGLVTALNHGVFPGGFSLGGVVLGNDGFPGYGGFYASGAQQVSVQISAQPLSSTGVMSIRARLLDSKRQLVGAEETGTNSIQFSRALMDGFYILEVRSGVNGPSVSFQASFLGPAIAGGSSIGSYVSQGAVGYGAFSIPDQQDVTFSTSGPVDGKYGAGCVQIQLFDANRNLLKTAP